MSTSSVVCRENFQRLQQDLAEMIRTCLAKRLQGSEKRKTLSTRPRRVEPYCKAIEEEQPEYLHLATVDNGNASL